MMPDIAVRGLDAVRLDAPPKQRVIAVGLDLLESGVRLSPHDDVERAIHQGTTFELYRGLPVSDQRVVWTVLLNRAFVMLHGEGWNQDREEDQANSGQAAALAVER